MNRQESATLITLGSSGAVSYQRFAHDELLAEGYLDTGMFASEPHPLLELHDMVRERGAEPWPRFRATKRGNRKRR